MSIKTKKRLNIIAWILVSIALILLGYGFWRLLR